MFIQMAHYHKNVIEFDIELFQNGAPNAMQMAQSSKTERSERERER